MDHAAHHVAAQPVGAPEEHRIARVDRADEVDVAGNDLPELVGRALDEEADRNLLLGIDGELAREALGVHDDLVAVDVKVEAGLVPEMELLRRRVGVARAVVERAHRGEEFGKGRDEVDEEHDDAARDREPVLLELPPAQPPRTGALHARHRPMVATIGALGSAGRDAGDGWGVGHGALY